ncbi:MAG: hypothetical protein LAT68_12545 [Cyclobacteriaceae bacterium]|nr:hypothetical protein [Cyclobacteriaceae bacterium]MCH8517147.1 hypothetical protein [Cyclobacteriaceae bacterium]
MALIKNKKKSIPISEDLRKYLIDFDRSLDLPIEYEDLLRYNNSIPLYDSEDRDTLWETVFYPQDDMKSIHLALKKIYALIKADGDLSVMEHLFVDRVDLCTYGNTQPFRVRIVNRINDNFDYFYIKNADASRIYGLELEHLLSPNRISYLVHKNTLIEEHIAGVPGDQFINQYLNDKKINETRLAKEFVKFTERCFIRLLGDMHSSNFVIDITPDFEEIHYRIRSIDFDQQAYEGPKGVYMPQYFKQNNELIALGMRQMTPETVRQYQKEERSLIAVRYKAARPVVERLLEVMKKDRIAPIENVKKLRKDLADHYDEPAFKKCTCMGEILELSLKLATQKTNISK